MIGGAFDLIDQNGNKFTDANLKGKYSLVYFGFTHCPDVCPLTLSNISLALKELGSDADKFQVIFITVDPENDTSASLKEYLKSFGMPITGLTGGGEKIAQAESAYRVYAQKIGVEVNHSSIIYVMDKNGQFISNLNSESKVEEIAAKLKAVIKD